MYLSGFLFDNLLQIYRQRTRHGNVRSGKKREGGKKRERDNRERKEKKKRNNIESKKMPVKRESPLKWRDEIVNERKCADYLGHPVYVYTV